MKEITDRRFPIGKFEHGKSYSNEDTRKHIRTIAQLPKDLKKVFKKLRDGALDKPYRAGGWTARQVIHHIADSNMNAYVRFKLAATENAPIIKPYEENLWAETDDSKYGSPKISIKLLTALHVRWVVFLTSLSEDDLERGYYHPANKRTVSIREAIALYAWHSKHHLAHLKMIADGNFEKKPAESKAPKFEKVVKPAAVAEGPKKRGRKPGVKAEVAPAPAVSGKRTRRSSAEVAAANAAKAAAPKLSRAEVMEKARAAAAANRAAKDATAPKAAAEKGKPGRKPNPNKAVAAPEVAVVKGKPGRKPNPNKAVAAPEVAVVKGKPGRKPNPNKAVAAPEVAVVKGKPGRKPNPAKAVAAPKVATEKGKPGRKPNPAIAAAKAAKAAAPKLSRAEVMEKARAVAAANRAAKAAAAPKKAAAAKPTRVRRSAEEVAAEKLAKANAPKLSRAEVMEKARAAAAANRAAKGLPAKPKKDPNAPKLSRAEVMEKARAARSAKKK
jgi:uncharacterized damage-inducible protein DinB